MDAPPAIGHSLWRHIDIAIVQDENLASTINKGHCVSFNCAQNVVGEMWRANFTGL